MAYKQLTDAERYTIAALRHELMSIPKIADRPGGTFWDADDDFGKPLQPLDEELHVTALVAGCERHTWLSPLLPSRPQHAEDCRECTGLGRIYVNGLKVESSDFVYCPKCRALGWTTSEAN